jgi:hypothetical protein
MGEKTNALNILVRKPEGRSFGIHTCRWNNIRMDLRELGVKVWTRFILLRTGSGGEILW